MSEQYENYIQELEENEYMSTQTTEAAAEAMGFVLSFHSLLKENGVDLPEEPDCSYLEGVIDSLMGELSAAAIFLSEDSFKEVPKVLRSIAKSIESQDGNFVAPGGEEGKSVPEVVRLGFLRLADRIEATRYQKTQMSNLVKEYESQISG